MKQDTEGILQDAYTQRKSDSTGKLTSYGISTFQVTSTIHISIIRSKRKHFQKFHKLHRVNKY